jgi:26S proteasome regulatory subunit N8
MVDGLIDIVRSNIPKGVVVHPTVLLSVVDHYNRIAKDTKKRVVGVLLGEYGDKGILDVTNCYAVPFEEDV